MPRPRKTDSLFASFIDALADAVASRLGGSRGAAPSAGKRGGRKSPLAGKKLDMSCRVAGCKNPSKASRFGFMCEEHTKLPKKEQQAAREAWKAKHA
jgi:hypothetical protein